MLVESIQMHPQTAAAAVSSHKAQDITQTNTHTLKHATTFSSRGISSIRQQFPLTKHRKSHRHTHTFIFIPIDSSRRQGFEYVINILIDTCSQKVMILDASWPTCHFSPGNFGLF